MVVFDEADTLFFKNRAQSGEGARLIEGARKAVMRDVHYEFLPYIFEKMLNKKLDNRRRFLENSQYLGYYQLLAETGRRFRLRLWAIPQHYFSDCVQDFRDHAMSAL